MHYHYDTILVPRASRSSATFIGPEIHGTGSARKLSVVSKAHTIELGRFRSVTIFTEKYYEELMYLL
jgi:hypothetical protein